MSVEKQRFSNILKKANQRLRTLEKSKYLHESYAYRYLTKEYNSNIPIFSLDSKNRLKFRTDVKNVMNNPEIAEKLYETVDKFLNSKTSTVKGIKDMTKRAYKSFISNPVNSDVSNLSYKEYLDRRHSFSVLKGLSDHLSSNFISNLTSVEAEELYADFEKNKMSEKSDSEINQWITEREMEKHDEIKEAKQKLANPKLLFRRKRKR